jgi:hypothetical protein
MNRYLVIARVGDKSLHPAWLEGATPHFDLYLSYFGNEPEKYKPQAQYYEQVKGGKWPILAQIIANNPAFIERYDAIWMPDDDLLADADTINRMFAFFTAFALDLAQPALTLNSYFSHSSLLQRPDSIIRYCNFVEVMAPIFSKNAMRCLQASFSQSPSGWGLDNLWPHLLDNSDKRKIAVIDATPVVHTRPLGGDLYKNNPELSPMRDVEALEALYSHLDINRRSHHNKFHVFAQAKLQACKSVTSAFLHAKYQRIHSKKLSKKIPKYGK